MAAHRTNSLAAIYNYHLLAGGSSLTPESPLSLWGQEPHRLTQRVIRSWKLNCQMACKSIKRF